MAAGDKCDVQVLSVKGVPADAVELLRLLHVQAVRLLMPKYHGDSMQALLAEYQELRSAGCSFIVAGGPRGVVTRAGAPLM